MASELLKDKVVVVSGVGPGLGRGLALQCAKAGADIVLAARNEARLAEVAKEVEDLGRRAVTVPTDINDAAACERLAETAVASFGRVDGLVNKPGTFALEDFVKPFTIEERIYRHRCVEAWSMVIPWLGFPLSDVIKRADPQGSAKYVAFETLVRPSEMPGQSAFFPALTWPYVEGLRLDEAMHPLTLVVTGLYGKPLPNQNGAPLRHVVPWKYGFKGAKSIVKIRFVEQQPATTWNLANPHEYGFYSNVNPTVDHPRWSQATERRIGELRRRPTLMFNGYADQVGPLYAGMDLRKYF